MADQVRTLVEVTYPMGTPESYGGEYDPDKQILQEEAYLNGEQGQGDYLNVLLDGDFAMVRVLSVERVPE